MRVVRLRSRSGVIVSVRDEKVDRLRKLGMVPVDETGTITDWDSYTVADLKDEIRRRNETRDRSDRLRVTGSKSELVAALTDDG